MNKIDVPIPGVLGTSLWAILVVIWLLPIAAQAQQSVEKKAENPIPQADEPAQAVEKPLSQ